MMWTIPLGLFLLFALSKSSSTSASTQPPQPPQPKKVVKENDGVQIPAGWTEIYSGKVPYELQMLAARQFPPETSRGTPLGTLRPFTYQGEQYGALLRAYYVATLIPTKVS